MVGKWIAIGLIGAGILVLALRPVVFFAPEERWVDVDGIDFAKQDAVSYSVNEGLRPMIGHRRYSTLFTVNVPDADVESSVRRKFHASAETLPAVLRMGPNGRQLLFYTANPQAVADIARNAEWRFTLTQDPQWRVYRALVIPGKTPSP